MTLPRHPHTGARVRFIIFFLTLTAQAATITTKSCGDEVTHEATYCYRDLDYDGYAAQLKDAPDYVFCDEENGWVVAGEGREYEDCNDNDPNVFPGAPEWCDDTDNDCDNEVDEEPTNPATWYADEDSDGFGTDLKWVESCDRPDGYDDSDTDCDDDDPAINPRADDICDGINNDCEDETDENVDGDKDGVSACEGDCNDRDGNYTYECPS